MSAEHHPADEELVRIAGELYAVVPAEFVAARNTRAAELRTSGAGAMAKQVAALPKATAPAWAVGAVARDRPADLDELSQLGAELRVAQASGNARELRELSRRRRVLTDRVAAAAAGLAEERGVALSAAALEQVAATWHAVVIDRAAERAVRSGLLVRPLEPGAVDLAAALAVATLVQEADDDGELAPATSGSTRGGDDDAGAEAAEQAAAERAEAEERAVAERALAVAERCAREAREDAAVAAEVLAQVRAQVLGAAAAVEEARRELTAREDELGVLDERQDAAREALEAAEAGLAAAEEALAVARERRQNE